MATVAMTGLGSRIRMRALAPSELPSNPAFTKAVSTRNPGSSPPNLKTFVSSVLHEGVTFMTEYVPSAFKVKSQGKPSPPSAATVQLFSNEITASELPQDVKFIGTETWFARTSIHENAAKAGTASFEEFDNGLRVNHSQNEMDYTPNIYDANEVCNWDAELESLGRTSGSWSEVRMCIMEMVHKIPPPLDDRIFAVLVLSARKEQEFIVVQIPVLTAAVTGAKYDNDSKRTMGMYCSVEHGTLVEDGTKVKWQMGTASDAKGVLPMFIQKMGVPGAVVKDVGLFIEWCDKQRTAKA